MNGRVAFVAAARRERPDWFDDAACCTDEVQIRIAYGEVDFYVPTSKYVGSTARAAIAVCDDCPVRLPCAIEGEQEHFGIWGGLTERERSRARSRVVTVEQTDAA